MHTMVASGDFGVRVRLAEEGVVEEGVGGIGNAQLGSGNCHAPVRTTVL